MTGPGRVLAVGLGPAGADLVLPAARRALRSAEARFVRTARHPAVADLAAEGLALTPLDHLYEEADAVEDVYRSIAAFLVAEAGRRGTVAYAVPGSPLVAERSVELLVAAAGRGEVAVEVVPGLSFAELAWARVGRPAGAGRVVDGRSFAVEAAGRAGPLLVAQVDDVHVCSDVKLALLEVLAADAPVTVLQRLGLPDERVTAVALEDLDRVVVPDHLTALYVDTGGDGVAGETAALVALSRRLRGPGGCPWDAEQTHHSLRRHLVEEAHEVVEAIDALPPGAPRGLAPGAPLPDAYALLEDELGDLLFQVVFHAVLAEEAGAFGFGDVARAVHDKLVRRHPHVFGDTEVSGADEVLRNWERIKQGEKPAAASLVDGIPPGLPALLHAHKLLRKVDAVHLLGGDLATALGAVRGAADRLAAAGGDGADAEVALGDLLAGAVAAARAVDLDAEAALRAWAARVRARVQAVEASARAEGRELTALAPDEVRRRFAGAP